jgi:hypothetical protein
MSDDRGFLWLTIFATTAVVDQPYPEINRVMPVMTQLLT